MLRKELLERPDIVVVELEANGFIIRWNAFVHRGGADEPIVVGEEWLLRWYRNMGTACGTTCKLHSGRGNAGSVLRKLHHAVPW